MRAFSHVPVSHYMHTCVEQSIWISRRESTFFPPTILLCRNIDKAGKIFLKKIHLGVKIRDLIIVLDTLPIPKFYLMWGRRVIFDGK